MAHQSDLIATDIEGYLKSHENKEMLRLLTCGSVDDGKSTLIGRLLYDAKMVFEDQLAALDADSKKMGTVGEELDFALLLDGLQSEREQGITIDVAYRFFSTDKRKFIIADTPGHEQYTRNMATGASTADLAVILIDARKGVLTQTRRHSFIAKLLGIRHVLVAVNKMDLVDYSQETFDAIKADYLELAEKLGLEHVIFVPLSALKGENVVEKSTAMPWYRGEPLMTILETVEVGGDRRDEAFRMPVQYVNRPNLDFRGFAGTIASGAVKKGDAVTVLPSGKSTRVKSIVTYDGELDEAFAPMAVTLTTTEEIDISRGDVLVAAEAPCPVADELEAMVVWMHETALEEGKSYLLKRAASTVTARVEKLLHEVDVNTMEERSAGKLELNGIGLCRLVLTEPMAVEPYEETKRMGAFILIDRMTNATVGAGMIRTAKKGSGASGNFSAFELELNALIRKHFPHWEAKDLASLLGR